MTRSNDLPRSLVATTVADALRKALFGLPLLTMSVGSVLAASEPPATLPKVLATAEIEEGYNAPTAASAKTDTPLRDVPQSISVVTRRDHR